MKNKVMLVITIMLLVVGFAAISTTLIINGSAKVSENTNDFSVIFTKATLDGTDVYANVISQDKKTITFETSDLKTLNQTSVLTYEVTNNSSNYDAEVTVNCKVKNDAEAKYTSIKNELEGNATVVKAKETLNGTLTVTLNKTATEEVTEEYVCTLEFNAIERDNLGSNVPEPVSFNEDSWSTIAANVKVGNTSKYNIGDTKEVDLGDLGTHIVRIANKSKCTNGETSETACGFVVEFTDSIIKRRFNGSSTSKGGWRDSELRTYINETIYNALPSELQDVITTTKVMSGYNSAIESQNIESQDKMYLLATKEVYDSVDTRGEILLDTLDTETRQLDYYKDKNVVSSMSSEVIKNYDGEACYWWLRSEQNYGTGEYFRGIDARGLWGAASAVSSNGISPAFRIA